MHILKWLNLLAPNRSVAQALRFRVSITPVHERSPGVRCIHATLGAGRPHGSPTLVGPGTQWPWRGAQWPRRDAQWNGPDVTHNGMAPTLVGARVSRARPSPRSEPPHSVPRWGRAAGDVGPYHSPTRTYSAPMLAPRRPGARSTRAALGAWRPNASGPVRWSRREGRNSVRPSTQARRRPGRHGGPGSGQPPLRAHGAQGVRFQCVIKSYS